MNVWASTAEEVRRWYRSRKLGKSMERGAGLARNAEPQHPADALTRAADAGRVCRAWHRTSEGQVLVPGVREAEGEEQGQGVVARRGLKEALSTRAGRRTGTGEEVWHARGAWARDHAALQSRWGRA
jgi:hypothetical protein